MASTAAPTIASVLSDIVFASLVWRDRKIVRCRLRASPPSGFEARPSDERAGDDRETVRDLHRQRRQVGEGDEPALALPGGEHEAIVRLRTGSARAAVLRPAEARQRQPDAHTECQRQNGTTAGPGDRRGPSW